MSQRLDPGMIPGLAIESPALRSIFQNDEKIHRSVETTADGRVVIQTSSDQTTVTALQQHTSEVTDFVKNGMAMHRAVMNGGGMMGRGMHGGTSGSVPNGKTADPRTGNSLSSREFRRTEALGSIWLGVRDDFRTWFVQNAA